MFFSRGRSGCEGQRYPDRHTRALSASAYRSSLKSDGLPGTPGNDGIAVALDHPRIHHLGKGCVKNMECRIESGNDGNGGEQGQKSASISPVKFERCAERLSETFVP
jgi:hypothetical protein